MQSWLIIAAVGANLGLIYLLMAAPLGRRRVVRDVAIFASRDRIWGALDPLGKDASWSGEILSAVRIEEDRIRETLSWEGRDGRPIERTVEFRPRGDRTGYRLRVVEDSSLDPSFWSDFEERASLSDDGNITRVRIAQTDSYRGLAFLLFRHFALRRRLAKLKVWCETGKYRKGGLFERPLTQFAMAVLSVLILWTLSGLTAGGLGLAVIITLVVALHELGHMAAFRVAGHRRARMIFVPLLGGIALGGRPYDTRFEVAFVALMGAGFSAFLIPPLMALSEATGHPFAREFVASLVGCIALFNLANLVPVWKFDGGQVLRQIVPEGGAALAAASFAILASFLWVGYLAGFSPRFLVAAGAVFALLSLLTAGSGAKPRDELKPASRAGRAALAAALLAVMTIHAVGVWWSFNMLA